MVVLRCGKRLPCDHPEVDAGPGAFVDIVEIDLRVQSLYIVTSMLLRTFGRATSERSRLSHCA
jgi:hypothetical protein